MKTSGIALFRNYNRIIAAAYLGLLAGVAVFFAFQLRQSLRGELAVIESQLERHGQFMEFVLRSSADQAEALRMALHDTCDATAAARVQQALDATPQGFHRDRLIERDGGANLVGRGPLAGRQGDFYCELSAALALDSHLRAMAFHLPHAARARMVSGHGFALHWPWVPSVAVPFDPSIFGAAIWQLSQPGANPDGLKFWAPPYFAGEDAGLLVPVVAPVVRDGHLRAAVSIDISLDYLNRVNSAFAYPLGAVSILDAQGRVLAHPRLFAEPLAVRSPGQLDQVIPARDIESFDDLLTVPPGKAMAVGELYLLRREFISAPGKWSLRCLRGRCGGVC